MNNAWIHEGRSVVVLAPRDVTVGDGVLVGSFFGRAVITALSGTVLDIDVVGVIDLAKDASTFTSGAKVYWDDTNHVATSSATGNREIGAAELTNPDGTSALGGQAGDATVRLRLNGVSFGVATFTGPNADQYAQVNLSAADIIALHSAPKVLVAAPGAGKALVVTGLVFEFTYGTVQMTGGGAVSPVYHGATVNLLSGAVAQATVQAAANANISPGGPAAALALTANTGVDLYAAGADFAAGDSTGKVTLFYRVITL